MIKAIKFTYNNNPDEPAHYITSGNTYPAPVAKFPAREAVEFALRLAELPSNAHLTFTVVDHPDA